MEVSGWINVWLKSVEESFHITITAACSADEFSVTSLFIVPGKQFNRAFVYHLCLPNAAIKKSPKGFTNSSVLIQWLLNFEQNIHGFVRMSIVLVYGGYGSHYSPNIVAKSIELKFIIILLPENSTHLILPLDISIFKPFKQFLKYS